MDLSLSELAEAQADVLRRSQLAALGIDRHAVRAHVEAHRWSTFGSMVVVLQSGPLTQTQRGFAAVLAAGRDAFLGGRTALRADGLRGWDDGSVHIVAPRGRTPPRIDAFPVTLHESRWPILGTQASFGRPPRTRVERSAIEGGGWSANSRTACGLIAAVVQQRLSTAERLLATLDQAGRVKHLVAMRLALQDIAGGAHALSEIDFARLCRRHGLGRVIHQAVRYDGAGRKRYLDALIESPSGTRVGCEVDGGLHLAVRSYWDDMSRANELLIAGEALLRFPTVAMRLDEDRVADQVRRALAQRAA